VNATAMRLANTDCSRFGVIIEQTSERWDQKREPVIHTHTNELASSTMHSKNPLRFHSFLIAVTTNSTDELSRQETSD
jgi:hypothetical protein